MEDVTVGEFLAWFITSGAFLVPIVLAGAWKILKDNRASNRRIRAKMFELGLIDSQGRRIRKDV